MLELIQQAIKHASRDKLLDINLFVIIFSFYYTKTIKENILNINPQKLYRMLGS
tara:strand:- start:318 stop:479 length:162 start_codon:yes stop_codon:yes gene_type:complete